MRIKNIGSLGIQPVLEKTLAGFLDTERDESGLVSRFERRFEQVHGVPGSHAVTAVSNGTDALSLAGEALDIGADDDAVVPGLTWQATAGGFLDINANPVLLDIDRRTLCLDPDALERYLEECVRHGRKLPKAIVVVHLFTRAANLTRIVAMCLKYDILLIEDCAHCHGGRWQGQALGTFGAIGTGSTQRTKPLSGLKRPDDNRWKCPTGSEGGFVITGVPALDMRLRALQSCGRRVAQSQIDSTVPVDELTAHWRKQVEQLGLKPYPLQSGNNRLPASVAERLVDHLERFEAEHQRRVAGMREVEEALNDQPGIFLLPPQEELTTPFVHMMPIGFQPEQFAGMDSELFRQVMSAKLDGYFLDAPYNPLGGGPAGYSSPVYNPQSKRRYRYSEAHWQAIDPAQWRLENAHWAAQHIVVLEHTALGESGIGDAVARAVSWTREHAPALVNAAS